MSISKEINYGVSSLDHGTYMYSRLIKQTGGTTVTLPPSANVDVSVFELPPAVFNLSKSYLSFLSTTPAGIATTYSKMFTHGTPHISAISLMTREGLFLCDLTSASLYSSMVLATEVTNDEVAQNAAPFVGGLCECVSQNDGDIFLAGTTYAAATDLTFSKTFTGLCHVIQGDIDAATAIRWRIPMSYFKNTLLAQNLDTYFGGQSVFLQITWNSADKLGYYGGDNTTTAIKAGGGNAVLGETILTDVYFNLALEQNIICQEVARSSKSFPIDFVYSNRLAITTGGVSTHSITTRYTRANGSKMKKIYYAPFSPTQTSFSALDHANIGGSKITTLNTSLNNQRLQQFNPLCGANAEDFGLMKENLKGTPLCNYRAYNQNWVWLEKLIGTPVSEEYSDDGFNLSEDLVYNITATCTGSLVHMVFACTQRTLTLENGRVTLT